MLRKEDFYMIHELRQQGVYQAEIAQRVGCSERTVRRQLALTKPLTKTRPGTTSKLDPFKSFIDSRLREDVWNSEVIFQELCERGYSGGKTILKRYIHPKRALRQSKATVRFETAPSQQMQHDWGEISTQVGQELVKVYFSVNTLGSSRRFHVWAGPKLDAQHTHHSIIESFEYFGGVPSQVLVDNQKPCVLNHAVNGRIEFNDAFRAMAKHYGFTPKACKPRRPQTKGKTERMVGYVKHNFFVRYRSFESFEHLNQLLTNWLSTVADARVLRQFQQTPMERFSEDYAALKALPSNRYDTSYQEQRQVTWDAYIEVRGNRYSVPSDQCGKTVNIRINLNSTLTVLDLAGQVLTVHRLQSKTLGWVTNNAHHQALHEAVQHRSLSEYEEVCCEA